MNIPSFWYGDLGSLLHTLDSEMAYREAPLNYPARFIPRVDSMEPEEDEPYDPIDECLQTFEGVGILDISGSLVSVESPWDPYFGQVSYGALSRGVLKLTEMYQEGEIHSAVLNIDSSGGAAEGISGLVEAIQMARSVIPDLVAFSATKAQSAGYWAACGCKKVYAERAARLGSIGVISVVRVMEKYYADLGIDHTIFRSGSQKALVTPFSKLSEAGAKQVQAEGDFLHQLFKEGVASARPALSLASADTWGNGASFFAEEAISLNLADGPPMSLNTLVARLVKKAARSQTTSNSPVGAANMAKTVLFPSEEARAAAMAGVPLNQVPHEEVEAPPADEPPVPEANAGDQPAPEAAIAPAAGQGDSALVALLREAQAQVTELTGKVATLTSQMEAHASAKALLEAETAALLPVAVEATHRFQVALGQAPTSLDGLPPATVVAQYSAARALLEERFPTGRKSLSAAQTDPEGQPDPQLARITLAAGEHTERAATL